MRVAPAGDNAELIELGEVSAEELHRVARAYAGLAHIVGHSSLYVFPGVRLLPEEEVRPPRAWRIAVAFDGPDLDEFLARVRSTRAAFLERIPTLTLTARYLGFRGGFAYLDGWPEEWSMPRRGTSRPVPRGSFAIAGGVAGFYPVDSPGGWNLLGRTDADLEHALRPGDRIALEPADVAAASSPRSTPAELQIPGADVVAAPLARLVGAPDYANLSRGLPPAGAYDEIAAALAKRALAHCDAVLECAMAGPRLRFTTDAAAAWCGPDLAVRRHRLARGEELAIGRITGGLRGYLAIGRGEGVVARLERGERRVVHALAGPHDVGLRELECVVTPKLDRVGIRLQPLRPLDVAIPADLRSIGMQFGTIQLHPDGSVVAMGPDHPVTGGYLQPATVITSERWKLGQLVPGERVTIRIDSPTAPRP